jgi:hypothetical protein
MLSWIKVLSICSMAYTASAVPTVDRGRVELRQVLENKVKIAFISNSPEGLRAARD